MTQWYGLLAPANLAAGAVEPRQAVGRDMKAMKAPTALERLNADAAIAVGGTPRTSQSS